MTAEAYAMSILDVAEKSEGDSDQTHRSRYVIYVILASLMVVSLELTTATLSQAEILSLSISGAGAILLILFHLRYFIADLRFNALVKRAKSRIELERWLHHHQITMDGVKNADRYGTGLLLCLAISLGTLSFHFSRNSFSGLAASFILTGVFIIRLDSRVKRLLQIVSSSPYEPCREILRSWTKSKAADQRLDSSIEQRKNEQVADEAAERKRRYEESDDGRAAAYRAQLQTVAERRQRARANPRACDHEWKHHSYCNEDITASFEKCVWCGAERNMWRRDSLYGESEHPEVRYPE